MSWTNILVPALGGEGDAARLATARVLAAPFGARLTLAFAAMSPDRLFHWATESAGPSDLAIAALERADAAGEARCRALLADLDYPHTAFVTVRSDDWLGLRLVARLADVVVWDRAATHRHGFFAPAFQQILLDERRPALIADRPPLLGGTVAIAWDGGREAASAMRRAVPLLRKADQVVLLTAPHALNRPCHEAGALAYLADHGIEAVAETIHAHGEAGPILLEAARGVGARLLVAGAFGHPRLQRFIFGGSTQVLLDGRAGGLFLSH